jgi:hypothetical protein
VIHENVFERFQALIEGDVITFAHKAKQRLKAEGWTVSFSQGPKEHRLVSDVRPWGVQNSDAWVATWFEIRASRTPSSAKTILRLEIKDPSGMVTVTTADGSLAAANVKTIGDHSLSVLENRANLGGIFDDFVRRVINYGD